MFASQDSIYDFFWPCPTPAPQICSSKLMALAPITPMLVAPCPSLSQCPGCPPVYPVGRTKTACFQLVLLAPSSDLSILGLWMSSYSITMHHPAPQARDLGVISAFLHPLPIPNHHILLILSQKWFQNLLYPFCQAAILFFPVLIFCNGLYLVSLPLTVPCS